MSYANLGLQQDAQGQFSPIAGFGISEMPSAEEIGNMDWNQRMGLFTTQMGQAQQQAQQANLGLFSQQLNEVGRFGAAGRQQISDVYSQERGRMGQSLAARGLGSTTVGSAMSAGIAGRESRDRTRLEESLGQQRLNVLHAASFQQPDMGSFYNQMMNAGSAGLGQDKPSQPPWWAGQALGAGLNFLTGGGGGMGGGGWGGGGGGALGKLFGFGGGGGGGTAGLASVTDGPLVPGTSIPGHPFNAGGGGGMMGGLTKALGGIKSFGVGAGKGIAGMFGFGGGTASLGGMAGLGATLGPIAATN